MMQVDLFKEPIKEFKFYFDAEITLKAKNLSEAHTILSQKLANIDKNFKSFQRRVI